MLVNLARAVQVLDVADLKPNVTLGEVQVANRNGTLVPIHGGNGTDGTTNVVSWGRMQSTVDPAIIGTSRETLVPGSTLAEVGDGADDRPAYRVTFGTSFLLALNYTEDGPEAKAFLTYGNPADRSSPEFLEATQRFSDKEWRTVAFTEADVTKATESTVVVTG